MRCCALSLVLVLASASTGYAQNQKGGFGTLQGSFGKPEATTGSLRGVYGPPSSAAGALPGVYPPTQPSYPTQLPTTIAGPSSSLSDSVPNVTLSGTADVGQSLPAGTKPTPIPDRPGYGRAVVNGRNAVVDMNSLQIFQLGD